MALKCPSQEFPLKTYTKKLMSATFTKGRRKDTVELGAMDDRMFREQFSKCLVVGLLICIMAIQNTQIGMN